VAYQEETLEATQEEVVTQEAEATQEEHQMAYQEETLGATQEEVGTQEGGAIQEEIRDFQSISHIKGNHFSSLLIRIWEILTPTHRKGRNFT